MSLFYKPLDQITENDIQNLMANEEREGRTIEYKEVLPSTSDKDKTEFRSDVSSFANAAGGDIIYGIEEKRQNGTPTGEPKAIKPLTCIPDKEELRLQQILQAHIEPRLPGGIRLNFLKLTKVGHVAIIRVPKSWTGLHLVKINDSYRCYSRHSSGKYTLDATEIRAGFVMAESGIERLRKFRLERVSRIIANEGEMLMPEEGPKIAVHIIPFSSLDPSIEFPFDALTSSHDFHPLLSSGWSYQYNFDGIVKFTTPSEEGTESYVQFFRNGTIEAVNCRGFDKKNKLISSGYERAIIKHVPKYLKTMKDVGVSEPLMIAISLLGVKGYFWQIDTFKWGPPGPRAFRENNLIVPEVIMDSFDRPCHTVLQPAVDRIWNAAGRNRSAYYDVDSGNWIGH